MLFECILCFPNDVVKYELNWICQRPIFNNPQGRTPTVWPALTELNDPISKINIQKRLV